MNLAELRRGQLNEIANWLDTTNELVNRAEVRAILTNIVEHVLALETAALRDAQTIDALRIEITRAVLKGGN
jgi:serine/threonine protein kinase HipA of HipAB toxin-antitoxin module